MNRDITILINSCDAYEDCWYPFFHLFKKFWPNCPYDIVLNSEHKTYEQSNLHIVHFDDIDGEGMAYGERMLANLHRIQTPYVLLLLDDFFLREPVDVDRLKDILSWMKADPNIAVFSFANVNDPLNTPSSRYPGFDLRPACGEYKLNLQAALWNRKKLMKYTRKHESPWDFETIGSYRTFFSKDHFYVLADETRSPIKYGKKPGLTWGVVRGKWCVEDVKPLFDKYNISVDYSIRGNYTGGETSFIPKRTWWVTLRSIGVKIWIQSQAFRVIRQIRKKIGKPVDADYIAYLRRAYCTKDV